MWQRFTERARKVVFYAQEEAGRLGENYVSTEHILLGLIREGDSVAARILDRLGVSLGRIRAEVERQVTRGDGRLGQDMQLTPRAKKVIDLAYDEARQLNNNYIGTEHLLLGLVREGEGLAGRVLAKLGVDLERTRREVMELQGEKQSSNVERILNDLTKPLFAAVEVACNRALTLGDRARVADFFVLALLSCDADDTVKLIGATKLNLPGLVADIEAFLDGLKRADHQPDAVTDEIAQIVVRAEDFVRKAKQNRIGFRHVLASAMWQASDDIDTLIVKHGSSRDALFALLMPAEFLSEEIVAEHSDNLRSRPGSRHVTASVHHDRLRVTTDTELNSAATIALSLAAAEAQTTRNRIVSDLDILVGLLQNTDSDASRILSLLGVTVDKVRNAAAGSEPPIDLAAPAPPPAHEALAVVVPNPQAPSDAPTHIVPAKPLSASAKRALVVAHGEADTEGADTTSAHHLLLALLQQKTGLTAQLVDTLGLDAALVRGILGSLADSTPEDDGE